MTTDGLHPQGPGGEPLGMVVDASLAHGAQVRLAPGVSVEDVKEGTYVTIQGQRSWFFGIVTDVSLGAVDPSVQTSPPDVTDPFIAQVVTDTLTFGALSVLPMLTLPAVLGDEAKPEPAKTVPSHFSRTFRASERDVELVFGKEDRTHFFIGNPLDMETKVCLNVEELVKRSSGIFGKSGTGKTFLTRLLLVGILQSDAASTLIFDMHSGYGWSGQDTDRGRSVKGLKQLFDSKVAVFSLDPESSIRRGCSPDFEVQIGYEEIEPEDLKLLRETLDLSDPMIDAAYALRRRWTQKEWLRSFLNLNGREEINELTDEINVHISSVLALQRRLARLQALGFMVPKAQADSVQLILQHLDQGKHVVLEFGRYGNDLTAYILVANLLTRRIHQRYVHATGGGRRRSRLGAPSPRHLHRGGPPISQPRRRLADHLRHHRPGAPQVQRHPHGHRPAPQRHRLRGHEPDRHQSRLPPGQRT